MLRLALAGILLAPTLSRVINRDAIEDLEHERGKPPV